MLSAYEKQELLWNEITSTDYTTNNQRLPVQSKLNFYWEALTRGLFNPWYLQRTVTTESDELPKNRTKLIHRHGTACKVTFVPTSDHNYTGLLASGACGILRVAVLLPASSFTVGYALKLLVDGEQSANLLMIPSLDGQQDNHNVFALAGSNWVSARAHGLKFKALIAALYLTTKFLIRKTIKPNLLPLDHIVSIRSDGSRESAPVIPGRLLFLPTPDSQMGGSIVKGQDYRDRLKKNIPQGTILFNVLAGKDCYEKPKIVGHLETTSDFVASQYGDDHLFFHHHAGMEPSESPFTVGDPSRF
jgi:hypothetical protein